MFSLLFTLAASKKRRRYRSNAYPYSEDWIRIAAVTADEGLVLYDTYEKNRTAIMTVPKGQNVTVLDYHTSISSSPFFQFDYNGITGYNTDSNVRYITNSAIGTEIADIAKSKIGCRYVYGASGPNTFDDTGLIYFAHKKAGVKTPRLKNDMYIRGQNINSNTLQPGDVLVISIWTSFGKAYDTLYLISDKISNGLKYFNFVRPRSTLAESTLNFSAETGGYKGYSFLRLW